MSDFADPSRTRLLRELYFNRTGLLFVLTILSTIGMYALAAHTHGDASAFWMTLATAIAATSAYAAFAVLLTTRQSHALLQTVIEETVRTNISTVANELVSTIRDQNSIYIPVASYPATNSPDPAFNRDLNRSFISSNNYIFQGITARYNIARLASSDTRFDLVRIIVADPTKPDSVVTRAKHVEHDVEGGLSGAHLAHVRAGMIDDIWMSIVGAHRCWRKSDRIEFCFLADPPIDRAEIFDTEMFLTRYSEPKSWGFEFPETDRFLQDSMPYQMHAKDCARLFTSKYTTLLQIPRDDDPKSLLRALREVGLDLDDIQYHRLEGEFRDLVRNLPEQMMPLSARPKELAA